MAEIRRSLGERFIEIPNKRHLLRIQLKPLKGLFLCPRSITRQWFSGIFKRQACITKCHTPRNPRYTHFCCECRLMPAFIDLSGRKFGALTVQSLNTERSTAKRKIWDCVCDCGKRKTCYGENLRQGRTKSCGCILSEASIQSRAKRRQFTKEEKPFRHIWRLMMRRCHNPNDGIYHHYGERGITVCERWHDYWNFKLDMYPRPEGMTLERIDNNQGYSPENCCWASREKQCNNRRTNNYQAINGVTKTVAEWCKDYGIGVGAVYQRLGRGWNIQEALTKPVRIFSKSNQKE